jgi:hypothetical protein
MEFMANDGVYRKAGIPLDVSAMPVRESGPERVMR